MGSRLRCQNLKCYKEFTFGDLPEPAREEEDKLGRTAGKLLFRCPACNHLCTMFKRKDGRRRPIAGIGWSERVE